jgi:hypothetical protein
MPALSEFRCTVPLSKKQSGCTNLYVLCCQVSAKFHVRAMYVLGMNTLIDMAAQKLSALIMASKRLTLPTGVQPVQS